MLHALADIDSDLRTQVNLFFESADPIARVRLASELADRILQVRGFFEWNSEPEQMPPP